MTKPDPKPKVPRRKRPLPADKRKRDFLEGWKRLNPDVEGGVQYRSCALVGAASGPLRPLINSLVVPRLFSDEKARAWLRHNVEEVGCFEQFLPDIYAAPPGS